MVTVSFLLHWGFPWPDDKMNFLFRELQWWGGNVRSEEWAASFLGHFVSCLADSVSSVFNRSLLEVLSVRLLCSLEVVLYLTILFLCSLYSYRFYFSTYSLTVFSFCWVVRYALKSLFCRCQFQNHHDYWGGRAGELEEHCLLPFSWTLKLMCTGFNNISFLWEG